MTATALATREEWLQKRQGGIGGSEAAAVLGVSRWKSPYQLWAEKTGLIERSSEETEIMKWGRIVEGPIADEYSRLTGRTVVRSHQPKIYTHTARPYMLCTPDALILQTEDKPTDGSLSIKTAAPWKAEEWSEAEPPIEYAIQAQHELAILGLSWASFAVLIWGRPLQWFDVARDDAFIAELEEACAEFWRRVELGDPPPPDGSEAARRALRKRFPREVERAVPLPAESLEWDGELQEIESSLKQLNVRRDELRNRLCAAIGDAARGVLPDGVAEWTWRTVQKAEHTVAATSYRMLRRVKARKR